MALRKRALNLAISLDQTFFCIITLGSSDPDETMSAAAYRLHEQGRRQGLFWRHVIDWLFLTLFNDEDHCRQAYLSEVNRRQLPGEYQEGERNA